MSIAELALALVVEMAPVLVVEMSPVFVVVVALVLTVEMAPLLIVEMAPVRRALDMEAADCCYLVYDNFGLALLIEKVLSDNRAALIDDLAPDVVAVPRN